MQSKIICRFGCLKISAFRFGCCDPFVKKKNLESLNFSMVVIVCLNFRNVLHCMMELGTYHGDDHEYVLLFKLFEVYQP